MLDRFFLRIPVVGTVVMQSNLFSLTSTFGTLLRSGIPSMEALVLAKESLGNVILRDRLDLIIDDVKGGMRLGPAFRDHWANPPSFPRALSPVKRPATYPTPSTTCLNTTSRKQPEPLAERRS